MRTLLLALSAAALSGCLTLEKPLCPGTRAYDPQICRGEKWVHIPNPPYAALQAKAKCDACIDIHQNCVWGIPQQCKPKWPWEEKK
jgi:hypothetical protein